MSTFAKHRILPLALICAFASTAWASPRARRVTNGRVKLRPTPTAPKMSVRVLQRLGVHVFRGPKGKLSVRPSATFDASKAKKLGFELQTRGKRSFLRFNPFAGLKIQARYPSKRRALAHFTAPKKGRVKVAFFDADSTLRVAPSGSPTADHAGDVRLLPGVAKKVKEMASKGYLIAIVSNQGGVEAGFINHAIAEGALRNTCRLLAAAGAPVHYFDYAGKRDQNRKPNPGMGHRLAKKVGKRYGKQIDWRRSIMVGDAGYKRGVDTRPDGKPGDDFSNSDRRFAESLRKSRRSPQGMTFHHPREFFGWGKKGIQGFHNAKDLNKFLKGALKTSY